MTQTEADMLPAALDGIEPGAPTLAEEFATLTQRAGLP